MTLKVENLQSQTASCFELYIQFSRCPLFSEFESHQNYKERGDIQEESKPLNDHIRNVTSDVFQVKKRDTLLPPQERCFNSGCSSNNWPSRGQSARCLVPLLSQF